MGQFSLRLPVKVDERVRILAKNHTRSINQQIVHMLSRSIREIDALRVQKSFEESKRR